jgi:GT2 family glycosyltransferase
MARVVARQYSVIVPWTADREVARTVDHLRLQTVEPRSFEILVVGPGRPPGVEPDDQVRVIETSLGEAADKRNLAITRSVGQLLLFTDDDCLPEPTWIERLAARIDGGDDIVGGSVRFPAGNLLQLADNLSAFHDMLEYSEPGPRPYLTTTNLCLRREVAEAVGGMPAGRSRAEDLEWTVLCRERGYRLAFEPAARVVHDPDRCDLAAFLRHWIDDAPHTIRVRLRHASSLATPRLAHRRWPFLVAAPLIALWATARTYRHPRTRARYWHVLPLVVLSKLVWCWSAWRHFPAPSERGLFVGPQLTSAGTPAGAPDP